MIPIFAIMFSMGVYAQNEYMVLQMHDGTKAEYAVTDVDYVYFKEQAVSDSNEVGNAVDLGLSVKWADHNIGATSSENYGSYYAWGETETKEEYTQDTYSYYDSLIGLIRIGGDIGRTAYDVATKEWGLNWRMPTKEEIEELIEDCVWTWATQNGVNGYYVRGCNGDSIFLPAAGYRSGLELNAASSCGYYWSSTANESEQDKDAYYLHFDSFVSGRHDGNDSGFGFTIRPVYNKDITTIPVRKEYVIVRLKNGEEEGYPVEDIDKVGAKDSVLASLCPAAAIDLGLSVKWANCNVEAQSPEEYGGYYAWGETEEKEDYSKDTYAYYYKGATDYDLSYYIGIGYDISGTDYDVAHVKWGGNWRMPTLAEIDELRNNCTWTWTAQDGCGGYLVTGKNGNSIFLPAAGCREGTQLGRCGSIGVYWGATIDSLDSSGAHRLEFRAPGCFVATSSWRPSGYTVRPVTE